MEISHGIDPRYLTTNAKYCWKFGNHWVINIAIRVKFAFSLIESSYWLVLLVQKLIHTSYTNQMITFGNWCTATSTFCREGQKNVIYWFTLTMHEYFIEYFINIRLWSMTAWVSMYSPFSLVKSELFTSFSFKDYYRRLAWSSRLCKTPASNGFHLSMSISIIRPAQTQ